MPAELIICLRHGEKPANAKDEALPLDDQGPGLDEHGAVERRSLTVRGWQRAGGLAATYLCDHVRPHAGAEPERILVPDYHATTSLHRSYQTVAPLSRRLGTMPVAAYERDDMAGLHSDLMAHTATAVVCWQHEQLIPLARRLVADTPPADWPEGRFDVLWLFRRRPNMEQYELEQVAQDLLS